MATAKCADHQVMRRIVLALVILVSLLAASCSSAAPETVSVGASNEQDSGVTTEAPAATGAPSSSTSVDAAPTTTNPPPPPTPNSDTFVRLDPLDALIPDGALGGNWEPLWRSEEFVPVPWNHQRMTSCPEFDRVTQFPELRATAKWSLSETVVNHFILQFDDAGNLATFMDAAEHLVERCPVVTWTGEDVQEEITEIDVEIETTWDLPVVSFESRQHTDVITKHSIVASGNLISVLTVEHWGDDVENLIGDDEFERLATLAAQWLEEARAIPVIDEAPVDEPADDLPEDLVSLLLSEDDLDRWLIVGTESVFDTEPRTDESGLCSPLESMLTINDWYEIERRLATKEPEVFSITQFIGTVPTIDIARSTMENFANLGDCPREVLFGEGSSSDVALTTELLTLPDADIAVIFRLSNDSEKFGTFVTLLVGNIVVRISSGDLGGDVTPDMIEEFAGIAASKVANNSES